MACVLPIFSLLDQAACVEQPKPTQWSALERELGFKFPVDYVQLITAVGTGKFGRGLCLFNPNAESEFVRLDTKNVANTISCIDDLSNDADISFYPEENGLIPIGGIDRHLLFYRNTCEMGFVHYLDVNAEGVTAV